MHVYTDYQLSDTLWYKIGGKARYFIQASSKEEIIQAVEFIHEKGVKKIFVCGLGSNVVFTDGFFDGAVIQITTPDKKDITLLDDNHIQAFAGVLLDDVINVGFENQLVGLEWAGGLPGTVGAAVRGNVGAYGGEIKDILQEAEVLMLLDDETYEIKRYTNAELRFTYRGSLIKENHGRMIILSALFKLKRASENELVEAKHIYEKHIQQRKERHPLEYPNTGSVFKNIREPEKVAEIIKKFPEIKDLVKEKWFNKVAVAYFIQKFGLQGYRVGDAQISKKHALFIVNLGKATANDVKQVIERVQSTCKEMFGFPLETEVEIVT